MIQARLLPLLLILLHSCDAPTPDVGPPPSPLHPMVFDGEVIESISTQIDSILAAPNDAELRRSLGLLYLANGGPAEATTALEQAIILDPADPRSWCFLGMAREQSGDLNGAIIAMANARELAPSHTPLYWRPGFWLIEEGRPEAAMPLFQQAAAEDARSIRPSPDGAAHRIGRARCLLDLDRPAEAIPILEELRGLVTHYYADYLLGQAYRRSGRSEDAAQLRIGATSDPPSFPDPWADAISASKRGLDGRLARIDELLDVNRLRDAANAITQARETWPKEVNLLHRLARLYSLQGNSTAWVRVLKQAARMDPDNAATQHNLSIALTRSGELNEALNHAHLAVSANPNMAEAWMQIGRLIIRLRGLDGAPGEDDKAAADAALVPIDHAFELGIQTPGEHLMYGHLLLRANRLADAQRVLQRLIERGDADPQAWSILSETWSASGDHQQALRTAIDGLNRFPSQPDLVRIVDRYRRATGGAPLP
ncbi:MAG: tetratricopeptide repeat protein [Phycisphaerales bacterium]|nr:tetratricopeptide repeat protein [Phycisphaerales bacterium]